MSWFLRALVSQRVQGMVPYIFWRGLNRGSSRHNLDLISCLRHLLWEFFATWRIYFGAPVFPLNFAWRLITSFLAPFSFAYTTKISQLASSALCLEISLAKFAMYSLTALLFESLLTFSPFSFAWRVNPDPMPHVWLQSSCLLLF